MFSKVEASNRIFYAPWIVWNVPRLWFQRKVKPVGKGIIIRRLHQRFVILIPCIDVRFQIICNF